MTRQHTSHTRTVLSSLPEASHWPVGSALSDVTRDVCPSKVYHFVSTESEHTSSPHKRDGARERLQILWLWKLGQQRVRINVELSAARQRQVCHYAVKRQSDAIP